MKCRFCRTPLNRIFIDLGQQPSANALVRSDQLYIREPEYLLKVFVCEKCLLVQIPKVRKAVDIFTCNYVYFSSYAKSWVEHAHRYVEKITAQKNLGSKSFVVEIASNDGYLLQHFVDKNIPCLGVDPASNCAEAAREKGVDTLIDFFSAGLARRLCEEYGQADLLLGNNVFAHVPDLNDFAEGLSILLKPDGILTLEFPHLAKLIENNQFDTIYDEHFSYFSFHVVCNVLAKQGLKVFDVEELITHGGSLRIYACHIINSVPLTSKAVSAMIELEYKQGLGDLAGYTKIQKNAETIRDDFISLVEEEKAKGNRIAAFGAAAKGNTFLNFCKIDSSIIDFVVDDTPAKQGLFLPGSHIPIVDEQKIMDEKPDVILILPWNLRTEIIDKLAYARGWGARFVTCIPEVVIH
jgi:SAM-dependent methyltransferase